MFGTDPVRFRKDLSPAVLACALDAQHRQPERIECRVVVLRDAGEREVRLRAAFGDRGTTVMYAEGVEQVREVVLERQPHPALAPVLDRQREAHEPIDVHFPATAKTLRQPFAN